MSDVTRILSKIESGDQQASEELLPLVYDELRKLAAARMTSQRPDHTLSATALVHEAYLRLVDQKQIQHWDSRGHFFSAAAEAMRRILIDNARRKLRPKHGGDRRQVDLEIESPATGETPDRLIAISEAFDRLQNRHPDIAGFVNLRYFAGLSLQEACSLLEISPATGKRRWAFARAFLYGELED